MSGFSGGYCPICGKSYGPEADRCPVHSFLFQSRDAFRPGDVIDGTFEILRRLGAGGMGETYLVRHAFLGENLVLKRIRPELAEDPLYQQSFLREAHSLAALRKLPAVVEIRHAWQTREGYLVLLLEYVEGGNLLQWLDAARGGGPLEILDALAIAGELAKALAAAHAVGVLHRDVKPQNILMRKLEVGGFQLKLCDFGLAVQRVEEMTRQGATTTRLGTPGYAAPEQYALPSREQDARVDVFGLGMTLYRLVAGRLPWEASDATWPLACTEERRKSLMELRPELGREYWLEDLLLRMTAVERNDRIATAAEALESMREALAETRPAQATVASPQPRASSPPIELPQPPPQASAVTPRERGIPRAQVAVPGGTGAERHAEPGAEMPGGMSAPADEKVRRRFVGRWAVALAACGIVAVALVAAFWLAHRGREDAAMVLRTRVEKAIQDHDWPGAGRAVQELSARGGPGEDAASLEKRIEEGKQSEVAGLQDAISRAIANGQWTQAGAGIARFERLAPGDSRAAQWRNQVDSGLASEQERRDGPDVARADQLLQHGDYPAAITLFQRVLAQDPGNILARDGLKQATDAQTTENRVFGRGR
ncbi:MAG: protein kinase [Bryobacteraceae bacterium]|jgi:serine/threonine protein kinase